MVYDKRDRLRFTQDTIQTSVNDWSFIKYDELNRPVITGILKNYSSGASALETATNAISLNETRDNNAINGYNNASYPTSNTDVYTVTYYDDYSFFNISGIGLSDSLRSTTYDNGIYNIQNKLAATNKGRVTGIMTMVLSDIVDIAAVPKNKLYCTSYYDKYGHLLRTISENHLGGKDVITNLYEDITFQVTQSKQEHHKGVEHITLEKLFEYDHTGRLLATREKVNSQPEITFNALKYNEVGEMITKYLHSNQTTGTRSFVQKVDYQYNIRGWLTQINDPTLGSDNDLYGMQLFYNNTTGMGNLAPSQGLYNGNIVGMKWNIKNDAMRGYQFSYDGLNRLSQANYAEGSSLSTNTGYFSESITNYDNNGNILGLQRKYNNTLVDGLTYTLFTKTNKIQRIVDSGTSDPAVDDYPGNSLDYIYSANGNMTFDGAKNLYIEYHHTLNLPQELDFGGNNRIFYHYTPTGVKLIKHTKPGTGPESLTHYIGNIVYIGGTLSYILTDEGRLIANGTGVDRKFLFEYSEKDHLGNNRLTFMGTDLGGAVDIVQTTSYYPFGLVMKQYNGNTSPDYQKNRYLYNSKELQDDKMTSEALTWYDYGARFYDPQIGRFHTVDPKAYKFFSTSPFSYCADNPMSRIDPNGKEWIISTWTDKKGKTHYDIYLTAVIVNESNDKNINNKQLENSTRAEMYRVFGHVKNVNFLLDLRTEKNISEVKGKEHIIHIVNPNHEKLYQFEKNGVKNYAPASGDLPFRNNPAGLNVYISSELAKETIDAYYYDNGAGYGGNKGNARSISHEFGHTAGWIHPDYDQASTYNMMEQYLNPKIENNQYNLMWPYNIVNKDFRKNYNWAIEITEEQLYILNRNYEKGKLNKK